MIEDVVIQSQAVRECCVVGYVDKMHSQGKLPIVYMVLNNNLSSCEEVKNELKQLCLRELPEYAQPVEWRFIEKIPLSNIGKIDYRTLEEV